MQKKLLLLVSLSAAAVLALPAAASAANSFGSGMFGFSLGGAIQNEDSTTLGRDLDGVQSAGSRWIRIDINWAQIQRGGPTSYDWAAIDRVVQGAAARGISVLGMIGYTPSWARPAGTASTYGPDPATYATFARTAVEHYSALGVHAYEVWNEPNIKNFWTPAPSPNQYTQVLKSAYPAIKAADPQATVLTGGTAPAPTDGTNYLPVDWLRGIYNNGGAGSFDAVSHHPYCWPAAPGDSETWSAWYQMYGTSPSLRSVMQNNGDGAKKIWATEFGAPTNGPAGSYVSESTQAQMISKGYTLWSGYDWGGPLFTYSGRDLGTSTTTRENFFGVIRNDFSQKPSFAAYKNAAVAFADAGGGTVEPAPAPDSGTPAPDSGTTVVVKGGKGKGKGKVSGRVLSGGSAVTVSSGHVKMKLFRAAQGKWRPATRSVATRVSSRGRFGRRLGSFRRNGRLRPGVYRVLARYSGSITAQPAASKSPSFTVG